MENKLKDPFEYRDHLLESESLIEYSKNNVPYTCLFLPGVFDTQRMAFIDKLLYKRARANHSIRSPALIASVVGGIQLFDRLNNINVFKCATESLFNLHTMLTCYGIVSKYYKPLPYFTNDETHYIKMKLREKNTSYIKYEMNLLQVLENHIIHLPNVMDFFYYLLSETPAISLGSTGVQSMVQLLILVLYSDVLSYCLPSEITWSCIYLLAHPPFSIDSLTPILQCPSYATHSITWSTYTQIRTIVLSLIQESNERKDRFEGLYKMFPTSCNYLHKKICSS